MIRCLLLLMLPLLAACATVKTRPVGLNSSNAEGVTYFLPKREILLSATRTPLVKEEIEKTIKKIESEISAAALEIAAQKQLQSEAVNQLANPLLSPEGKRKYADQKSFSDFVIPKLEAENKERGINKSRLLNAIAQQVAGTCQFIYDVKLELLAATADTSQRFVANLSHSVLRDDEQKFVVTQGGLLSSADVTATDRAGDILVELAGAVGAFGSGGGVTKLNLSDNAAKPAPVACELTIKNFRYQFNPKDSHSVSQANEALKAGNWPFAIEPENTNSQSGPKQAPTADGVFADKPVIAEKHESARDTQLASAGVDGLVYRTAVPFLLTLWQCNSGSDCQTHVANRAMLQTIATPVQAASFLVPQAGPVSYIPLRSSAFVKTVDNVVFSDGVLTSWAANRPSEVFEVVRLPVRILKALISVPAEIIKLRVDYSNQTQTLTDAYAKQLAAEQNLIDLQQCVRIAEASEQSDPSSCFQ